MSAEVTPVLSTAAVAGVGPIPPAVQVPAAAAATIAAVAAPLAPVIPPPPAPAALTVTPEQWAAFANMEKRLGELQEAENKRQQDAQAEQLKAMRAKGEIEQAFALQRQQAQAEIDAQRTKLRETEDRAKRYALDGELGRALSSQPLVPGGAEQLTQLWRNQFVVEPQGDSFTVRTSDFQPVGAFIAAQLGRPEYAHFVRAQNPGGGTAGGTAVQSAHTAAATPAAAVQPRNLGDAIALQMANIAKQQGANAHLSGGSILNEDGGITRERAEGFGLRPRARQA